MRRKAVSVGDKPDPLDLEISPVVTGFAVEEVSVTPIDVKVDTEGRVLPSWQSPPLLTVVFLTVLVFMVSVAVIVMVAVHVGQLNSISARIDDIMAALNISST
jgi:hypothetical protein